MNTELRLEAEKEFQKNHCKRMKKKLSGKIVG